jgi:hypothetical protein
MYIHYVAATVCMDTVMDTLFVCMDTKDAKENDESGNDAVQLWLDVSATAEAVLELELRTVEQNDSYNDLDEVSSQTKTRLKHAFQMLGESQLLCTEEVRSQ